MTSPHGSKLNPALGQGQSYLHNIPYVGHKRLTVVSTPIHTVRVRPSIILAEIDRINHRVRPSLAYQPTEDYLNSRYSVSFDDETRDIRAQTNALLKRINAPLPRASRALPVITSRYEETPLPARITSDAYIDRMLGPVRNVQREIESRSHYNEPARGHHIGKGHLACVQYSGGRAFSRRKNLFYPDDDQVKNDVKFLSHYERMRTAAKGPQTDVQGSEAKA